MAQLVKSRFSLAPSPEAGSETAECQAILVEFDFGSSGNSKSAREIAFHESQAALDRGCFVWLDLDAQNPREARGMLKSFGLEVDGAEHGKQALAKLAAGRYDVVLMDCQMPEMDGYAATRELRRMEGGQAHTPVIALTADITETARKACSAAGMDDYVGKPFSRAALHVVLSRWLVAKPAFPSGRADVRPAGASLR